MMSIMPGHPLPPAFYARPAAEVARDLLGAVVESSIGGVLCSGRIVEVEAYTGPEDDASHAAARIGRTARNEVMFGAPGLVYVYRIYGVHWCMNAVTDSLGHPAAVLIRAAEPLDGLDIARARRGGNREFEVMRGPGNLCRALGVSADQNGHWLGAPPLRILAGEAVPDDRVLRGPRVGVTRGVDLPLRFSIAKSPHVSGQKNPMTPTRRSVAAVRKDRSRSESP